VTEKTEDKQCINLVSLHAFSKSVLRPAELCTLSGGNMLKVIGITYMKVDTVRYYLRRTDCSSTLHDITTETNVTNT
jgi:hypothetical protein